MLCDNRWDSFEHLSLNVRVMLRCLGWVCVGPPELWDTALDKGCLRGHQWSMSQLEAQKVLDIQWCWNCRLAINFVWPPLLRNLHLEGFSCHLCGPPVHTHPVCSPSPSIVYLWFRASHVTSSWVNYHLITTHLKALLLPPYDWVQTILFSFHEL
jgi:hypothetical protein